MIGKAARKRMNSKYFVALVCLLMAGNLVHGTVLCFGADGHVKIESAFHERCESEPHSDADHLLLQASHADDHHCEPCVDLPVSIGFAKMSRASKQLNPTFVGHVENVITAAKRRITSAFDPVSHDPAATSYFDPLRTVILLV